MSKVVHFTKENEDLNNIPKRLSASIEGSFAYRTVKDRLPLILVSITNTLCKHKEEVRKEHCQDGPEDVKTVTGKISKLRYELMTNKPIEHLIDELADVSVWNNYMDKLVEDECSIAWYSGSWLFVECYMYRSIISAFKLSSCLKSFDPFGQLKRDAFDQSLPAISSVLSFLSHCSEPPSGDPSQLERLTHFLELALWGNRCDLSISAGADNSQTTNPISLLGKNNDMLLVNDTQTLWEYLLILAKKVADGGKCQIDIILDNAGFEVVSDICLAEVLLRLKFATRIVFHVKSYPWFVSDVTREDLRYTVRQLRDSSVYGDRLHANRWIERESDKSFVYKDDMFWTTCYDFPEMEKAFPELHAKLARSDLLIFKGDLNYRKLLGDRDWPYDTPFSRALNGFYPTSILALRTLKSNVLSNADLKRCEQISKSEKNWMETGQYGVIQFLNCKHL